MSLHCVGRVGQVASDIRVGVPTWVCHRSAHTIDLRGTHGLDGCKCVLTNAMEDTCRDSGYH